MGTFALDLFGPPETVFLARLGEGRSRFVGLVFMGPLE